jgi:kynurenine formamidase
MPLFDSDGAPLAAAFNKPSEKQVEHIIARRLCKALGIDYTALDKKADSHSNILEQVVDQYLTLNPKAVEQVKNLLPSTSILAREIRHDKPKTAHDMGISLRSCAY